MKRLKNLLLSGRLLKGAALRLLAPLGLCVFLLTTEPVHAQSSHVPWRKLSQSQLTAVWWQWFLGLTVSQNPGFDPTGAGALNGQPYPDLVFLCGTFALNPDPNDPNGVIGEANRSITVKPGTALFFPLINFEQDNVALRPGRLLGVPGGNLSVPQMQAITRAAMDSVIAESLNSTLTRDATVTPLGYSRLQAPVFAYKMPKTGNIYQYFGINVSGPIAPAVADGYWTLVAPGTLQTGSYVLEFGGQVPGFTQDITYNITVAP